MEEFEKIKPLLQEMGDAINNSLSDSQAILDAINHIKEAGYEVYLVLEANIGLNKLGDVNEPTHAIPPTPLLRDGERDSILPINRQDKKFLRALKISF